MRTTLYTASSRLFSHRLSVRPSVRPNFSNLYNLILWITGCLFYSVLKSFVTVFSRYNFLSHTYQQLLRISNNLEGFSNFVCLEAQNAIALSARKLYTRNDTNANRVNA